MSHFFKFCLLIQSTNERAKRRIMKSVFMLASIMYLSMASAAGSEPFSQSKFEIAAQSNKPVIVGFHAASCGSCKIQKPNMQSILNENSFKETVGLLADFESTVEFRKHMKKPVRSPSTIVIFQGGLEVARVQGVTDKDELRTQLQNAINK